MHLAGYETRKRVPIRMCHRGRAPVLAQVDQANIGAQEVGAVLTTLANSAEAGPTAPTILVPLARLLARRRGVVLVFSR